MGRRALGASAIGIVMVTTTLVLVGGIDLAGGRTPGRPDASDGGGGGGGGGGGDDGGVFDARRPTDGRRTFDAAPAPDGAPPRPDGRPAPRPTPDAMPAPDAMPPPPPPCDKPSCKDTRLDCRLSVDTQIDTDQDDGPRWPACTYPDPAAPPPPAYHETSTSRIRFSGPVKLGYDLPAPGKGRPHFQLDVDARPADGARATLRYSATGIDGSLGSLELVTLVRVTGGLFLDDAPTGVVGGGGLDLLAKVSGEKIVPDSYDKPGACDGLSEGRLLACKRGNCTYQPIVQDIAEQQSIALTPIPPVMPYAVPGTTASFAMDTKAIADGIRSGKPFSVTGVGTQTVVSGKITVSSHSTITLACGDLPYEAVFGPGLRGDAAADQAYRDWVPQGPTIADTMKGADKHGGNTLPVVAYLRDKKTGKPLTGLAYRVVFTLESSKHVGYAMNLPPKDRAQEKVDLVFDDVHNDPKKVKIDAKDAVTEATTEMSTSPAFVTITSWDYGGYATLSAKIEVEGQAPIAATFESPARGTAKAIAATPTLTVPLDVDGDHVADRWAADMKVLNAGYHATWDRDDAPSGMANHGDGLTLYEEYRGFVAVDAYQDPPRQIMRTDPRARDLFVRLTGDAKILPLFAQGVARFAAITHLAVHYIPDDRFLARAPDDKPGDGPFPARWVDFNDHLGAFKGSSWRGDGVDFGPEQAAVDIVQVEVLPPSNPDQLPPSGNTPCVASVPCDGGHLAHTSPMQVTAIRVSRKNNEDTVSGWANVMKAAARQLNGGAKCPGGTPDTCYDEYDPKVAGSHGPGPNARARMVAAVRTSHVDPKALQAIAEEVLANQTLRTGFVDSLIVFTVFHELGHATGARHHGAPGVGEGGGAKTCPMRYWQLGGKNTGVVPLHEDEQIRFLMAAFDPAQTAPDGTPWAFCTTDDDDRGGMRLHQAPGDYYNATATDTP